MASVRTRKGRHTALYRDAEGHQHSAGTFDDYDEADKAARAAEERPETPAEPESTVLLEKDGLPTLAGYVPDFLDGHDLSSHSRLTYASILSAHILPEFGDLTFPEITPALVRRWLRKLEKGGRRKHSTLMKIKVVASSITESAIEDHEVTGAADNPFRRAKVHGATSPVRRVLTPEEMDRIRKYIPAPWSTRVDLVEMTGMRIEEVMGLEDTDIAGTIISVHRVLNALPHGFEEKPRTKTGEPRVVQVTPAMAQKLRALGPGRLFPPISHSDFWYMWNSAVRSAGLDWEPQPRDVRHCFARWTKDGGASIDEVMQAMGHTNIQTTIGYIGKSEQAPGNALAAYLSTRRGSGKGKVA